ncbi:ESPR-type extended signal peptide-containing protein [uncultured Dialister sp.]|uniref:ESPR-type extended signal peptide-containing protein n=1 Tax=uncultured Dialister sp. TaxID=278064 RepID=UPI0025957B14|nr:ESPR-type extended signal peptide-containing protein [uncultured Dialister sp.]
MNKIYKVIWSKAKHTYVVASEIAKGHTKGETTGRGLKKLAAALLVAAALLSPSFAWAADTVTVTDPITSTTVKVYTKEGADTQVNVAKTYTYRKVAAEEHAREAADTEIKQAMTDQKTSTALHVSKDGNLIVGTKEKQTVKDMKIRGKLTSGSISTGDITSSGDVTVTGKMAADGVTDETTNDGTYIKQNNTVGNNLVSLDTQVKANADAINEEARKRKYSVTNLEKADAAEAATREAADNELNERITNEANAIHDEIKAGDEKLDTRITNVKEYLETQTSENYVSKTDAAVQDAGVVKADKKIGENVTALGKGLYDETAARIGADAAQDKVIQAVNNNLVQSVTTINKNVADGFTALNQADAKEAEAREAKDNELNERITNEANAIHDEIKAGDKVLDDRITNVKEYLEKQTSDNYVSKADAAVQDGAVVKAANTIGENVTNLDAALAKETAARIGADAAQDKVIEQVNQNMVDGFNTINKNMADGFTALNNADLKEAQERAAADTALDDKITAETSARVAADTKLVEATNGGVSLSNDNVLQKNTTTIDAQGNVTTSKTDANEMILNKGKDNQITLNEKGIKVGTNSSVMDKDGVYTGGDTYSEAKAALKSDGQIKGANGKFTVDASGNTTVTSLDAGTGTIQTKGDLYAKDATFSGDITAKDATLSGDLSAKDGTFSGDLSAKDGTFSGDVSAKDVTATGTLQGAEVTDGTATMKNGNITGVKNLSAETITTSGDATIGGDLTVNGKLNVDEIDLTKNGIIGDNNVTASTKVAAGEITGYKKATSTKDGSEKESAIDYDENGTSTWAKATDADGNWKKSTLTVEGSDVTSKVTDSDKNSNTSTQTASESNSTITGTADGKNYKSYITQNLKNILQKIEDGDGNVLTSTEQTETDITNTAANGTITNDAKALVNKASDSITSQIGDGSAVKSVMDANGIANTATGGTISNSAANISNTTTGNMTNTVGGNLIDTIMGTSTTTVTGKVTEDYKSDLSTKVGGDETHAVTGNQTTTVSGNRTVNVKGTETENFNALVTSIKTDQKTSVGGNQTNIVGGDQQNTVSGSKTETVKGSVTEKYGSQATTVDGDQSTHVGGNQSNVVAGNQTNTISGSKTESVKGAVTETYGSQSTTVNGNQSNTVKGTLTETVTGDVTEDYKANLSTKVGGNQTTTVTGDSSLSAKNITNTASEKITNQIGDGSAVKSEMTADGITNTAEGGTIYNKSKDILNEASGDILNFADGEIGNVATKITNITGDNTVTSDTNGTTFENKAHSTAVKEGTVTKTTISGNTITTGEAVMDYADVMKDLGVRGNAAVDGNTTLGKEGADTTLTVNSTSTFKKDVTMKSNATVEKNLTVNGQSTFNDKVTITNGGLAVTGGTTTDKLHVTSTSQFDGAATFKDIVTMEKDLNVGGNAKVAGDVTAKSFKVGDKTYIDGNGINANDQVIRNVGQGNISEGSTDAVSGGQLYETNTRVSGLETRMGTVETRVDKLDGKIDKVGANAAAMANLHPLEFDEDSKWNIAAAVGSSGSETASAVGVFYRPNENVMVNASAAMGTGENMFGGGVSLRLGHGGNKAKEAQMKAAAAENKELRAKVDDLTARMDALLSVLNPNMSKDFPDVPENHWAYEAVSRLAGNGIVEGYEDGKYHGERQMTRYEMAEIIYNALSKGAKAEKKLVEEFRPELQAMAAQKKA